MPELIISPAARRDLVDQTADYRDQGTPVTADRWVNKTHKAFKLLAAQSGIGEESALLSTFPDVESERLAQKRPLDRHQI